MFRWYDDDGQSIDSIHWSMRKFYYLFFLFNSIQQIVVKIDLKFKHLYHSLLMIYYNDILTIFLLFIIIIIINNNRCHDDNNNNNKKWCHPYTIDCQQFTMFFVLLLLIIIIQFIIIIINHRKNHYRSRFELDLNQKKKNFLPLESDNCIYKYKYIIYWQHTLHFKYIDYNNMMILFVMFLLIHVIVV